MERSFMDFLQTIIPIIKVLLSLAPEMVDDVKRLADAIRNHPDSAVRPGAKHLDEAIKAAEAC